VWARGVAFEARKVAVSAFDGVNEASSDPKGVSTRPRRSVRRLNRQWSLPKEGSRTIERNLFRVVAAQSAARRWKLATKKVVTAADRLPEDHSEDVSEGGGSMSITPGSVLASFWEDAEASVAGEMEAEGNDEEQQDGGSEGYGSESDGSEGGGSMPITPGSALASFWEDAEASVAGEMEAEGNEEEQDEDFDGGMAKDSGCSVNEDKAAVFGLCSPKMVSAFGGATAVLPMRLGAGTRSARPRKRRSKQHLAPLEASAEEQPIITRHIPSTPTDLRSHQFMVYPLRAGKGNREGSVNGENGMIGTRRRLASNGRSQLLASMSIPTATR
jgi:hypothetical protein